MSKGKKSPRDIAIVNLQKVSRERPHPSDLWTTITDAETSLFLEKGLHNMGALLQFYVTQKQLDVIPDRVFALIISTAVEQTLQLAITTHFSVDDATAERMFDDGANGPFTTFAAKIKTAYALGIFPRFMRDELDMIRHIRNAFAHSWQQIGFESPEIVAGCSALLLPDHVTIQNQYDEKPWTAKKRFVISVRCLFVYLEWDSVGAGQGPMRAETHPGRKSFPGLWEESSGSANNHQPP